MLEAESTQGP